MTQDKTMTAQDYYDLVAAVNTPDRGEDGKTNESQNLLASRFLFNVERIATALETLAASFKDDEISTELLNIDDDEDEDDEIEDPDFKN